MATISMVVPAAGCGVRAGLSGNKILAPLGGRPLLWWTLRALLLSARQPAEPSAQLQAAQYLEIVIAARRDEWDDIRTVLSLLDHDLSCPLQIMEGGCNINPAQQRRGDLPIRLVEGGETRQQSVGNAVRHAPGDFVLVHDAARPLLAGDLIARTVQAALRDGAAIAALPVADTVKLVTAASKVGPFVVNETLKRETIWLAQTPQVFRRAILQHALERAEADSFVGTDCASLVERLRDENGAALHSVTVVPGEERNFKVTYAADLQRAAALLNDFANDFAGAPVTAADATG